MDAAAEEGVLDVDILADEGSEDEGDAPPSSGPASTPTSCASSPRGEEPASPHGSAGQPSFFHHQPYVRPFFTSNRRGPGRPRKEGVKLAKEGKIVRRYRGGNAGCLRGAKRARGSRDDEEVGEEDDFTMPAPEEPPYFPEKWPGKLCSLCNLGERSQLGQGEMRQIICNIEGVLDNGGSTPSASNSGSATPTIMATPSSTPTTPIPPGLGSPPPELLDPNQHPLAVPLSRRQKSHNKCKTPIYNLEHVDELSIIGHLESIEINAVVSSGAFYVHRLCLEFSPPFQDQVAPASNSEEEKEQLEEGRVKGVVTAGLFRKCAFCQRYGASIPCKMSCSKYFHFPCVLASGGFIDYQTKSSFCKDHLHQVPLICTADLNCRTCHVVGDLSNLMTCVTCGGHFHGTCVGLAQLPGVRAGWSCRGCRACQVCRGEVWTESRAVTCEHCDKLYHAACLRPPIATVPKYGWKCKCCRVCSDCGSRSPGAGPSSRWHAHYSVCDSCYQQRNKGCCCPLCRRAYRAAAMRDMLRCHKCTKYVHTMCDPEADPVQNRLRKEQTPSYEYVCPICKSNKGSFEEETTQTSQDSSSFGDDSTQEQDPLAIETKTDVGLGKGKPYTVSAKVAKKKIGVYKKGGFSPAGKLSFQKRQRTSYMEFGRKRGTKSKMRGVFGVPGLGLQRPQAPDIKNSTDDDPGLENKLVLCSSKDKFVLTQDLCVMCGAIGTDSEGCLIACAQCGQSYHPYCVNIKVSGVIVKLGWRCLECTVCEGCGLRGDDALLVLCDECDTAWHTYCARPALANVPRGAWRCERCRQCLTCGTRDTQHYTECDGCSSLHSCSVCSEPYSDGELIIQCSGCRRWLHAACDRIATESDADKCARHPYKCIGCRGGSLPPPHLAAAPPPPPAAARPPPPSPRALGLGGEYYVDDVCLSQRGAHHMKMLEAEMGVTHQRRKRRFKNDVDKDSATQNAEDGEDNKPDSTAEVKDELGIPNANYKEGIPWNVATEGPPPEGFTIFTTDMGLTVLRRKRQRNLNKLGIGGFVVRQRQCNSKNQGDDDKDDGQPGSGESPGNKRKPRRKPRSKLMEQIPSYMQEAFFGKDLLEPSKPAVTSSGPDTTPTIRPPSPLSSVIYREPRDNNSESSDEEVLLALSTSPHPHNTINLNPEFLELLLSLKPKEEKDDSQSASADGSALIKTELTDDGHLKHTEDSTALKNAILGPQHSEGTVEQQTPNTDSIPTVHGTKTESIRSVSESGVPSQQRLGGVECVSLLGVNLEAMVRDTLPDMDTNDVDEIFKGVLTDDSQESQESTASYITSVPSTPYSQQRQQLQSPLEYASPYHTEYGSSSNSQLSPAFPDNSADVNAAAPVSTYNQRSADKMRADESLGAAATISAVLYANTNHPEWKAEFPSWVDRCKQILKKWRALPSEQKAPYLQRARDNRSAIRMKKAQQTATEGGPPSTPATPAAGPTPTPAAAPPAAATPALPTASAAATATATASPPQVVRAPNVTVTAGGLLEADQHIRVLTPSEIMRTLPPLHTEQERTTGVQRSAREAEQERQWKQLQQMRQQQTQHHHQVINDQRLQGNPLQAMRLRGPDGAEIIQGVVGVPDNTMVGGGPRSVFPAQRIPLHYGNASEHINRQLRDLLQRQSDNMWPPKAGSEEGVMQTNIDGSQQFRQPLPVGLRMRQPLQPGQRPDQQLLLQQRIIQSADGGKIQQTLQQSGEMKQTIVVHSNMQASEKQDGASDQGHDEMDMGDMDKLEQDTGNIGEVGDILTGLGGEDDEELLESLTAEIGEEFNILEYADPELASLNDAENILDGLELAEDGMTDRHAKREPHDGTTPKADNKLNAELQKSIKNIEMAKTIKSETESGSTEIKQENPGLQGYADNSQQRAIIQGQMNAQQSQLNIGTVKAEIKTEGDDWQRTQTQPQHFHSVRLPHQHPQGAVLAARRAQLQAGGTGQVMQQTFTQQGTAVGGQATTVQVNTAQIVSAMTAQVNAALAAGRVIAPGTRLVGADGAVGVVRHDRTVALHTLPHIATAVGGRPPPPPPYPGTLRQQPPPPPYPQQVPYDPMEPWPDWLHHRRPLLLQEQPLLLEELLEQEKREQERDVGGGGVEWAGGAGAGRAGGAAAPATPPAPAPAPLFAAAPPPAPPLPDAAAPPLAHQRYELWLAQYNAFAADQQRYYEHEVQKLRKIRKSLNSKQRQARKSGNELLPNDAAELRRVSTEQQALQKHLEAARKQSRQHTMLMQEYETKQRQNNPQLATQQTVGSQQQPMQGNQQQQIFTSSPINQQQQIFTSTPINQQSPQIQHQTITRPMQLGLQGNVQQQTLFRTQQVLNSDGQSQGITQQRIGLVTSPLNSQGRIIQQGGRTLVIEQGQQQQLVRQLSGQERPQVTGMVQFGQQQIVRNTMPVGAVRQPRPAMSPLHVQSPHSQSPLHMAPQSPLHHLTSPMQSPLHSQQSPLHHTSQSPLHTSTQSPLHTQQSPLHSQQSPLHVQQTGNLSQSPMHPQQSPMHQSPIHHQQQTSHSPLHMQQSPMNIQQSSMHMQQSPMHQQSQLHQQQQQQQTSQSPLHMQQSPMHMQQSPMHMQQSPMHSQQSPLQTSMSPQHFLQQLQAQRTSPQLPTPSRSPQIYQQSQIQSPVSSHSPQLQNIDYSGGRFPRPAPGCSPLPTRFARPPHHQQGMRVGVPFNARQQPQSPLGSPQPMPSPGNPNSEMNQRGGGGGSAPVSPCVAPGARAHTPAASPGARAHTPAASPLHEHGGGHAAHQPFPPGYLYTKPGLFGGAPIWPERRNNQPPSTSQDDDQHYLLYTGDSLDYNPDDPRLDYNPKDDDDDIEEIMDEHLDDTDIVVVEPAALSPQERIATEEDFEELIDGGKPEDDLEEETTQEKRTETTTKTVAVISLSSANKPPTSLHQYKLVNPSQSTLSRLPMLSATMLSSHTNTKILNEVSQATVASVSIANQTISVPVLKSLTVPMAGVSGHSTVRPQIKKVPLNIGQQINIGPNSQLNKPLTSVISVISSNLQKSSNPIITLATSNVPGASRVPVSLLTQHQVQQKIVKTIEKPLSLSLANTKLSNLSVSHDVHLPAKIFQDDAYSPDSTNLDPPQEKDRPITTQDLQAYKKEIDIESEISQQTELPHTLCLSDRTPMLLGKSDIKSPSPIPEKIPDNIMEGDDDDREDEVQPNILLSYKPSEPPVTSQSLKEDESVVKTIKAIANQTKEMVIGSNMQITSDVAQESVQISIPSPTPSQERYLNDISMHERDEIADPGQKHVESFEDMLCMLENITDDAKPSTAKTQSLPTSQAQAKNESEQVLDIIKSQQDRLNLQTSSVPQLSPLTQPAELTSNMANVSQQLRTIMSSLNTAANKAEASARKPIDVVAPTQVNFENLLPSSKVEVAAPRPSPVPNKPSPTSESIQLSQLVGSRVNTLSSMPQHRKSPSPIHSPVTMHGGLIKSPAQSPLITNQCFISADEINPVSSASQVIQMPMLAKIHPLSTATPTILQQTSTVTTNLSGIQKAQSISTSILGHTLLQPTRQMNPISSAFSSQSISSSQPPALIMSSRPLMGKQEPPPNVTVRHNILSTVMSQVSTAKPTSSLNFITSSKLLHTQLTSPLKRSKSTDEPKTDLVVGHIQPTKRRSVESVIVKSEPMETEESNTSLNTADANKPKQSSPLTQKTDESQNVLLKQLLQTTSSAATVVTQRPLAIQRTAPALGTIPSLEAQLARPPIPPPSLSLPQEVKIPDSNPRQMPPQTTYIQRPIPTSLPITMASLMQTTTQSLMDVRKTTKVIPKEESTPLPENSPTMKAMPIYPMVIDQQQVIKKEVAPPLQSPVQRPFTPMDVKKELLDECSQQSAASGMSTASDQGKLDHPIKDEFPESVTMDTAAEVNPAETPTEAKKRKRREYQQKKRKQMQMNQKAAAENNVNVANAKKRPRKGSKYEEDYDTFIDNLMAQLRLLPPMQIQEPPLTTNFSVCPLFGSGDLTKLKNREYDLLKGDLYGEFGNARIPNVGDYYNTKPFGEEEPLPEKPQASTQRGFYDQEFQPIMFDEDPEEKKLEFVCKERDTDTPDSIVSCSSPECLEIDPPNKFPGLKLIDDEDEEEDSDSTGRISPAIPLIAPVPIRLKPVSVVQLKEEEEKQQIKLELESPAKVNAPDSPGSTDSNENVTVTLTLTSGAAEDILGVLKELAGILHIPPPTAYQIVERTATPPSHKLGLYRSKGKDGKEGAPVDIQSILNGAAKFCRHCDVVILDSVVRAKASEFPLLSANKDGILCDSDSDLYFCSTQCYERFSWRPTNIILDGKSKSIKDDKSDIDANLSKDRDDFDTASTESMETDDLDIKPDIKDEKMDLSFIDSLDNDELMKEVGDDVNLVDEDLKSEDDKSDSDKEKDKYKGVCYKFWSPGCIGPPVKYKRPTDRELTELVFRTGVAMMPVKSEDARKCELCGVQGDGVADGVSRLLNCEVDRWVHLNCALWSEGVYETVSGALMNVETALAAGSNATCSVCKRLGATLKCFKVRCGNVYHLGCAVKDNCVFYKNKTAFCSSHAPKGEKENELTTLSVWRRVFISRDEQRQVASVMLHCDTDHLLRVGGLIFLSPGHLLPHQLSAFHTNQYIYPVGYKIVRFYWSTVRANSRCRYLCWISEVEGRPQFHVRPQDHAGDEVTAPTARAAWDKVLDAVSSLRENRNEEGVLKLWPNYVTGEDLFGLTEPAVVRVLENLPGIETLTDYRFKFGRSALLEGGLALNPSGAARCEGRPRTAPAFRRAIGPAPTPHAEPSSSLQLPHSHHAAQPYTKQFVHTKSSQYKKMKCEWRNNVYLARSKIQGLGLYAARDIEKHTMVIEYIGEIIRSELSEMREKKYEARNRGIYMFRLDERRVVDATLSGGLARYINHSCAPNCVAETVEVDRQVRIIIFAKRRIARGEELAYDYKFDIEDDAHKIQCMCGAPNCRKWMN